MPFNNVWKIVDNEGLLRSILSYYIASVSTTGHTIWRNINIVYGKDIPSYDNIFSYNECNGSTNVVLGGITVMMRN